MKMTKRRDTLKILALGTTASLSGLKVLAAAHSPRWTSFAEPGDPFGRAPILLMGKTDAILIDGGSRLSDGKTIAAKIKRTGKLLTTVYVTCSDPDYYFNLKPIVAAFPNAKVIAPVSIADAIKRTVQSKIDFSGPLLKGDAPASVQDVVFPGPSDVTRLDLDGRAIDVVAAKDMADRYYIWVPDLKAVFGGVLVSSGVHVWTADSPTPAMRAAWIAELDRIAARHPLVVIPGHRPIGTPDGMVALKYTKDYLVAFEQEIAKAKSSGELISAMKKRYPKALFPDQLEICAKVAMGEMKWG